MVAADLARGLDAGEEESLLGALAGRYPAEQPFDALAAASRRGRRGPRARSSAAASACWSATLGTPFAPDLDGGDRLLGGRQRAAVPDRPHVDPPGALG